MRHRIQKWIWWRASLAIIVHHMVDEAWPITNSKWGDELINKMKKKFTSPNIRRKNEWKMHPLFNKTLTNMGSPYQEERERDCCIRHSLSGVIPWGRFFKLIRQWDFLRLIWCSKWNIADQEITYSDGEKAELRLIQLRTLGWSKEDYRNGRISYSYSL